MQAITRFLLLPLLVLAVTWAAISHPQQAAAGLGDLLGGLTDHPMVVSALILLALALALGPTVLATAAVTGALILVAGARGWLLAVACSF
jgi:hypothetical protein